MRIVLTLLLSFFSQTLVAQKDTIWKIIDKVYIKAPIDVNIRIHNNSSFYLGRAGSLIRKGLSYNTLDWENETHKFRVSIGFDNSTFRFMEYAKDLDSLYWLSEELKCEIMGTKLKKYGRGWLPYKDIRNSIMYSLTKWERINDKYYYLDTRSHKSLIGDKTIDQIVRDSDKGKKKYTKRGISLWGIPLYFYDKRLGYKAQFTRYLLVDSVMCKFSIEAKKKIYGPQKRVKALKKKLEKNHHKHQSFFYDFIERIMIRKEEEDIKK